MSKIRYLKSSDIEAIYELYRKVKSAYLWPIGGDWQIPQFLQVIEKKQVIGSFSQQNGLLSFVIFKRLDDDCDILLIITQSERQKQGYMKELLTTLMKQEKAKTYFVEVHEKNIGAIEFYKKLSFEQVGMRKDFYGQGQNAYLLAKKG
ncbi:MAG: GNAT family N-acetyltransferase [Bdellovibrionales bacterium]|nr:GNAT family N-acetyltransferase [Bdellovibrionales bacterium]